MLCCFRFDNRSEAISAMMMARARCRSGRIGRPGSAVDPSVREWFLPGGPRLQSEISREVHQQMAEKELDCRGLACPNPVIKTKDVLDAGGVDRITVLVDNPAAGENVTRFLERFGYRVSTVEKGGVFSVLGSLADPSACAVPEPRTVEAAGSRKKILIFLATDRLGRGDDVLGRKLIGNFLATLKEMGEELWRLVLVNAGVKLATEGSAVLDTLQELERSGVQSLVCGTCLDHFQLLEQKRVGETTNMLDIVTSMQLADQVISLT